MTDFDTQYKDQIYCILHGFDRMILKGHIEHFFYGNNVYHFLNQEGVRHIDFKNFVLNNNKKLKNQHVPTTV